MILTAPTVCPKCYTSEVDIDPAEVEQFQCPPRLCRCAVAAHVEAILAHGWRPAGSDRLALLNDARVPTYSNVAGYDAPKRKPARLHFARFAPAWACAILDNLAMARSMKIVCLRKGATLPEGHDAANAVLRTGGPDALVTFLLRALRVEHAPEDAPTPQRDPGWTPW